ncbi:MAG: hypothetical protein WDZ31_01550 [Phycisphaeraceae bacterium]
MDTITPSWQRWYFRVAVVFWGFALCAMIAAMAWGLLQQPSAALLFTGVAGGCMGAMILWQAWVFPWFRAKDGPSEAADTPRQELRDLRFVIWLPIVSLAVIGLLLAVGEPALRYVMQGQWQWSAAMTLGFVLLGGLGPACLWCHWLARRVTRRFQQRTADMRLCFHCGYDLRGSPGPTCPECGGDRGAFTR